MTSCNRSPVCVIPRLRLRAFIKKSKPALPMSKNSGISSF